MTRTLNSLSSSVLTILREDAENQNVRNTALQKTMNENFDRVREDNRKSFELISEKSEKLKDEVKAGMDGIREGNEKKLSEIQGIVDTKLQETLDRRITQSFEAVTENLSKLYKAMGTLDVLTGDVKKMNSLFSNVKSRGVWGEMQAENILSDILTPDQWVKNYSPKKNREMVEFAIRLPGKDTGEIYLPIDSKFPVADYERYKNAVDAADSAAVESEVKNLRKVIEKEAKTIRDLYIVPPETTDFALLFLPSEALYLEMLKIDGLVEKIQNEYRVVLTGPNNFSALLSSLSLGFKTMQIEAYTSNIWHLFEDLKKLFADLSKSVDESKKSVDRASESLERARVKKEKISSVLTRMESNADRASIGSREEYYLESEEENSES
jgi:DNA recombination protein RmuC